MVALGRIEQLELDHVSVVAEKREREYDPGKKENEEWMV